MSKFHLSIALLVLMNGHVQATDNNDPYENINRKIFAFNDTLDKYLLKPVATAYKKVAPRSVDRGISNMFDNVADVPGAISAALQGKGGAAMRDTSRVLINSTVGVVGFFDVASKMGIESGDEDFGQTLAVWGVGEGPYVMLPFLGGRTLRETASLGVDTYLNPITYVDHVPTKNSLRAVDIVDGRADLLEAESLLKGDRYSLYREAYYQRRALLLNDGRVDDKFGNEAFGDDIFDDQ